MARHISAPRLRFRGIATLVGLSVVYAGCSALIDVGADFDETPGGSAAAGASGSGDKGKAGEGGAGGQSSGSVTGGADGVSCGTGELRCSGLTPERCSDTGEWVVARPACAASCVAGDCVECASGDAQCENGAVQSCVDGDWQTEQVCEVTCEDGACVDACTEGRLQCSGDTLQHCNDERYVDEQTCEFVCRDGSCSGECKPDSKRCDENGGAQSCTAAGEWGDSTACADGTFCVNGDCKPCEPGSVRCGQAGPQLCGPSGEWVNQGSCPDETPACVDGECALCSPGERRCNDNDLEECDDDGRGYSTVQTCEGDTPACLDSIKACGRCAEGQTQCQQNTLQSCSDSGAWETLAVCTGSSPKCTATGDDSASCTECDPSTEDRQCLDADTVQACAEDGSWGDTSDCTGSTPVCREDLGATCGCEEGERRCAGNTPEQCVGGAWVAQSSCSGQLDYCLPATGKCVLCEPGEVRCQNGVAEECADNGTFSSLDSCAGEDFNCGGCDVGEPCEGPEDCNSGACLNEVCVTCTPDETQSCGDCGQQTCTDQGSWGSCEPTSSDSECVNANASVRSCGSDGNYDIVDCPANRECSGGECLKINQQQCSDDSECVSDSCVIFYFDFDEDGFGDPDVTQGYCTNRPAGSGYVAEAGDCCDTDPGANPDADTPQENANACGSFDWNCDDDEHATYGQAGCTRETSSCIPGGAGFGGPVPCGNTSTWYTSCAMNPPNPPCGTCFDCTPSGAMGSRPQTCL